jgi:hypothetical protein
MSKSLAQVIDALLAQGYNKPQVLDVLASEYWIDSSVTRYLATV